MPHTRFLYPSLLLVGYCTFITLFPRCCSLPLPFTPPFFTLVRWLVLPTTPLCRWFVDSVLRVYLFATFVYLTSPYHPTPPRSSSATTFPALTGVTLRARVLSFLTYYWLHLHPLYLAVCLVHFYLVGSLPRAAFGRSVYAHLPARFYSPPPRFCVCVCTLLVYVTFALRLVLLLPTRTHFAFTITLRYRACLLRFTFATTLPATFCYALPRSQLPALRFTVPLRSCRTTLPSYGFYRVTFHRPVRSYLPFVPFPYGCPTLYHHVRSRTTLHSTYQFTFTAFVYVIFFLPVAVPQLILPLPPRRSVLFMVLPTTC